MRGGGSLVGDLLVLRLFLVHSHVTGKLVRPRERLATIRFCTGVWPSPSVCTQLS